MSNSTNKMHMALWFPKETIDRIDKHKGSYYSRNKYVLKVIEEHLKKVNNEQEAVLIANAIEKAK